MQLHTNRHGHRDADTDADADHHADTLPAVFPVRAIVNAYAYAGQRAWTGVLMADCPNDKCENGLVYEWSTTRHGWETRARACEECNWSGKVADEPCCGFAGSNRCYCNDDEGDERHQPCRDSGLPSLEEISAWKRLRD